MKSIQKIIQDLKSQVPEISAPELNKMMEQGGILVVDVREPDETANGMIPGSEAVPRGVLELEISGLSSGENKKIIIYCASGMRSILAASSLKNMGFEEVYSLSGGFQSWKNQGYPIQAVENLSGQAQARYSAQTRIPEVGEAGQTKLAKAKVLVVGTGGLGSPACLYLAAAGVGTLGIIDDDAVDVGNLQRQVLHTSDRVGLPKVDSAFLTLKNLNPTIKVEKYKERLTVENVDRIFPQYDIIVDGVDNFQTRYLVNDACIKHGKINIHGSVFQFTGQCTVFCAPGGPCYRCLYEAPPPAELAPNCAEAGVLGVLPGTVGLLQATETLKAILNLGDSLVGRLLHYDAEACTFKEFKIKKNPHCAVCSKMPSQITYSNYEEFCNARH